MSHPSLLEILKKTTTWFESKGVPNPRLDAELIIAHCLKKKRMDLYLAFDQPMYEEDLTPIRQMIQRRGLREPLQHILGTTGFRYLEVNCSSDALIPRPETEVLVDLGLNILSDMDDRDSPLKSLEIGTGTGIIALSLVKEFKSQSQTLEMSALDISPQALALAKSNAALNEVDGIEWIQSDLLDQVQPQTSYDLIISNPPYIPQSEMAELEPEVRDFDPQLALVGGDTGLELPQKLILESLPYLKPQGVIVLELGPHQPTTLLQWVQSTALGKDLAAFEEFEDLNGMSRFLQLTFA